MHHCRRAWHISTLLATLAITASLPAHATEGASGLYLLGSQSLDAGLSPAPGWYFSVAAARYDGFVGGAIQGGVRVVQLEKRSDALTGVLVYAPRQKVLGGQLALSVGTPYAYLKLSGEVSAATTVQRSVSGSGRGDTSLGARIGWQQSASFTHALALTVWAPTGDYQKGFTPSIGHHRWAGDLAWSFTYAPGNHHTEMSAAIGYGVNGPNAQTRYHSGNELHLELAVGQRISPNFELGLAGYTYQQVSADSGPGAFLGTLKGRVSGVGPALSYRCKIGSHGVALGARYYREFDAKRHFQGNLALVSATMRF